MNKFTRQERRYIGLANWIKVCHILSHITFIMAIIRNETVLWVMSLAVILSWKLCNKSIDRYLLESGILKKIFSSEE